MLVIAKYSAGRPRFYASKSALAKCCTEGLPVSVHPYATAKGCTGGLQVFVHLYATAKCSAGGWQLSANNFTVMKHKR